MNRCYNCVHWRQTQTWKGNCGLHPWNKDRYNEDATGNGCEDYRDKYSDYQPISQTIKAIKEVLKGVLNDK